MASTCNWDPTTKSFKVTLNPPAAGSPDSCKVHLEATPVTPQVTNRVYSSYKGVPANGIGAGYSWWQIAQGGGNPSTPDWNIIGPEVGGQPLVVYVTPTYESTPNSWGFYNNAMPVVPNKYKFPDPTGGGSSSITIQIIEGGGGGLSM